MELGKRLQRDGHRIRLATHEIFRSFVLESGLEFFPLGGDPYKLSQYMVRTQGFIIPSMSDMIDLVPENISMLRDIIYSCWGACTQVDEKDVNAK